MHWVYNDGGRKIAGFKNETSDCVVRAIAIVTQKPYQEIYDAINNMAKTEHKTKTKGKTSNCSKFLKLLAFRKVQSNSRTGVYKKTWHKYAESLGMKWTPCMQVGSGCKYHLREGELPAGRLLVSVSKHLTAVIDGVIYDTFDPSRNGNRCVYGYYSY